jgi:uncharacterized phage-associated protein
VLYILDILETLGNKIPTIYHVCNILYFADKEHLEKYGRFISGDRYQAVKYGAVPKEIYNLMSFVSGNSLPNGFHQTLKIYEEVSQAFKIDDEYIEKLRKPNTDFLSQSDIECLNHAVDKYRFLSFNELKELSQDQAWCSTNANALINLKDIVATFDNSQELFEHLQNPHP